MLHEVSRRVFWVRAILDDSGSKRATALPPFRALAELAADARGMRRHPRNYPVFGGGRSGYPV